MRGHRASGEADVARRYAAGGTIRYIPDRMGCRHREASESRDVAAQARSGWLSSVLEGDALRLLFRAAVRLADGHSDGVVAMAAPESELVFAGGARSAEVPDPSIGVALTLDAESDRVQISPGYRPVHVYARPLAIADIRKSERVDREIAVGRRRRRLGLLHRSPECCHVRTGISIVYATYNRSERVDPPRLRKGPVGSKSGGKRKLLHVDVAGDIDRPDCRPATVSRVDAADDGDGTVVIPSRDSVRPRTLAG